MHEAASLFLMESFVIRLPYRRHDILPSLPTTTNELFPQISVLGFEKTQRIIPILKRDHCKMALLRDLPNELVMQIIEYLQTQKELKSSTLINRRFHALFDDYLTASILYMDKAVRSSGPQAGAGKLRLARCSILARMSMALYGKLYLNSSNP